MLSLPSAGSPAAPASGNAHSRVHELDGLRFVAAMSVVLFHLVWRGPLMGLTAPTLPALAPIARYGHLGVELFFIISGFVILMTALATDLRGFVASRLARLYPAFWACCTATFVAILLAGAPAFHATWPQFAVNLSMVAGFVGVPHIDGVYWSLEVEILFYVLAGLVLARGPIEKPERWLAGWLVFAFIAVQGLPWQVVRWTVSLHAPYFVGGAVAFLIWQRGASLLRLSLFAASTAFGIERALDRSVHRADDDPLVVALLVASFFAVILAIALRRTGPLQRWRAATLGALTYPLYLLHEVIGHILIARLMPALDGATALAITLGVVLAASYAVHRLIERPFAPVLRRLVLRRGPARVPAAAG